MVSEELCSLSTNIFDEKIHHNKDKVRLLNGISRMPKNKTRSDHASVDPTSGPDPVRNEDTIEIFLRRLMDEICDSAIDVAETGSVKTREKKLTLEGKHLRTANRRVSIVNDAVNECRNNFVNLHRRAVSECILRDSELDENDNEAFKKPQPPNATKDDKRNKDKKKKKLSFSSIFGKKDRVRSKDSREEEETHDNLAQLPVFRSNTLAKGKKFASALELNQKVPPSRTPSIFKRIVHNIGEDSSNFIKRSLSFREANKKSEMAAPPTREKLVQKMNQEWKQSLQSLVETDTSVSYNDLSFIDYDALNDINYEPVDLRAGTKSSSAGYIGRTQSMIERRSPNLRRPVFQRLTSANDRLSTSSLPVPSPAVSLPSLHHSNQDNVERITDDYASVPRYRRRPQSVSSEDGGRRPSSYGNGSFRSAGSGCSKLKRHNACRQKVRDPAFYIEPRQSESDTDRAVSEFLFD